MSRPVHETATGTSDVLGGCTLRIVGPHRTGDIWRLRTLVISSTKGSGYPTAAVYRSAVVPSALLGESRAADKVTFNATTDELYPSDQLVIVLANVAPSTVVTANLYATEVAT